MKRTMTPPPPVAIDRIANDGNITEHDVHPSDPNKTACGLPLRTCQTQKPCQNRRCRNCDARRKRLEGL